MEKSLGSPAPAVPRALQKRRGVLSAPHHPLLEHHRRGGHRQRQPEQAVLHAGDQRGEKLPLQRSQEDDGAADACADDYGGDAHAARCAQGVEARVVWGAEYAAQPRAGRGD